MVFSIFGSIGTFDPGVFLLFFVFNRILEKCIRSIRIPILVILLLVILSLIIRWGQIVIIHWIIIGVFSIFSGIVFLLLFPEIEARELIIGVRVSLVEKLFHFMAP